MRSVAVVALSCAVSLAWGAAPRFEGTFQSDLGRVTLRQTGANVIGSVIAQGKTVAIAGKVKKNALAGTFRWPDGSVQEFRATLAGDTLTLKIKGGSTYALRRIGGSTAGTVDDEPSGPGRLTGPDVLRTSPVAGATGTLYKSDGEGWQFRLPKGWKHGVQAGKVLVGSDTEAGAIIAFYQEGLTLAQMEQQARAGLQEQGVNLMPTAAPARFTVKGMGAIAVELSGTAGDGSALRARAIGVAGPSGGAVFVGITTPAHYANLRTRTDQVAQSVGFFRPNASAMTRLLVGEYWHYKGSGSTSGGHYSGWSSEKWLSLCPNGTFIYRTQSDVSVNTEGGSAGSYGQGGGTGRWTVLGSGGSGTLKLAFQDGSVQTFPLLIKEMCKSSQVACDLEVNGLWFGRDSKLRNCQ